MGVQDDRREIEQLELFELQPPTAKSRSGTDAVLEIGGQLVEFELKSTTKDSVTTVRDFGLDHIAKWSAKHWLFGFYTPKGNALRFTRYASPQMMNPWIEEKRRYIATDFALAEAASNGLTLATLYQILGEKKIYSLDEAKSLHKKQLSAKQYAALIGPQGGVSPESMLDLLKLRCRYVIERGSTLNNPHIPKAALEAFPIITANHADELRRLVAESLNA
jgi:hypothetical protein